jgi:hypothetical protein
VEKVRRVRIERPGMHPDTSRVYIQTLKESHAIGFQKFEAEKFNDYIVRGSIRNQNKLLLHGDCTTE